MSLLASQNPQFQANSGIFRRVFFSFFQNSPPARTAIVLLPRRGEFKAASGTSRLWCHVSLLSAVSSCSGEGLIPLFRLPARAGSIKGEDVYDGRAAFEREVSQRRRMGGIGIGTAVMWRERQEHPSPRVGTSGGGSLGRAGSIITLPGEAGMRQGGRWAGGQRHLRHLGLTVTLVDFLFCLVFFQIQISLFHWLTFTCYTHTISLRTIPFCVQ